MSKILNVAVIGLSSMGQLHCGGVLANKSANLYAICDSAPERLEEARKLYPDARALLDYRELVADPRVDAAVIVVPDKLHLEMTVAFLRAGKDVLCEKPMALTLEECEKMMKVERETGRSLMIGQVCRFTDAFKMAKSIIDSGKIGELTFIESEYAHDYGVARGYNDWRVDPDRHGVIGGGCHAIDLLRWIAGDPTDVCSFANHKVLTDWPVDDTAIAIYKFPKGVIGKVFVSIGCKRNYTMRSVFYGTKGTIICDNTSPTLTLFAVDEEGGYTTPHEKEVIVDNHNCVAEIDLFVGALIKGEGMPIPSIEGASTVAVCYATVESAKTGQTVPIRYPKD